MIGWTIYHYAFKNCKFTVVGACEGVIAGLVGITPAAGFVTVRKTNGLEGFPEHVAPREVSTWDRGTFLPRSTSVPKKSANILRLCFSHGEL